MNSNRSDWVTTFIKVLSFFRPKVYNTLTRVIVFAGLGLLLVSQLNVFEALVVAGFEYLFGPADYLRGLFATSYSPWIGFGLVFIALFYHAAITVGLKVAENYKAKVPKQPLFSVELRDVDDGLITSLLKSRGILCKTPLSQDTPDYFIPNNKTNLGINFSSISLSYSEPRCNEDFYRDRARLVREWGGAEIIRLSIANIGEALGRNVTVKLIIPQAEGIRVNCEKQMFPAPPRKEIDSLSRVLPPVASIVERYDIKLINEANEHVFYWDVGDLQTGMKKRANTELFIRAERDTCLNILIFCDEFSSPMELKMPIIAPKKVLFIDEDDLTTSESDFDKLSNKVIMDGYRERVYSKAIKKMEQLNLKNK